MSSTDLLRNLPFTYHLYFLSYHFEDVSWKYLRDSESNSKCRAGVGVVEEAAEKEPGEAKFEGVMWHGGYDQSITSSAARAPHTAPILPGPLPFVRYTSAMAERRQREEETKEEKEKNRMMHAYKFACRLWRRRDPWRSSVTRLFVYPAYIRNICVYIRNRSGRCAMHLCHPMQ